MVEGTSKQVRVDNWGIFFLQRLQLFFNKTDYCDLTLQFEGNVQLKVHRLVLNACTEYFQILEQTCEVVDDVLIMPPDLQADVVLPIINFMYTGMLEFHTAIFDKLYRTAELMNITVLTKLLDAQKQPVAPIQKSVTKKNSTAAHTWNLQGKKIVAKTGTSELPPTLPGRKLPVWKRKSAPVPVTHSAVSQYYTETKRTPPSDSLFTQDNTPKPTRFEWPEEELNKFNILDSNFDDITYTSKPLLTQEEEMRASTSFDDIKHIPSTKRRSSKSYDDNSAIDMEEMKNYVKEQKIRSDLVEFDDEEAADNDLDNSNNVPSALKRKMDKSDTSSPKRVRFNLNEKENKEVKINVTSSNKTGEVDHTKIISELLRKYPDLMKKKKNIRLKIMAKSNKPQSTPETQHQSVKSTSKVKVPVPSPPKANLLDEKKKDEGPWLCSRCSTPNEPMEFVLYYLYRKHMTDVHNEKFDSRMCKYCGHKSNKHNMLMYHLYTKHGIKPPPAYNFPKCNQCPYIALTEALLVKHKLNHSKYELQCVECKVAFNSQHSLTSHMQITGHTGKSDKNNYDCQYCTKRYQTGANLFSHIKMQHRAEARRDGIVSIDEIEDVEDLDDEGDNEMVEQNQSSDEYITPEIIHGSENEKVKIISNLELPSLKSQEIVQQNVTLEPSSEAEALSNVASGIATSLGLVDIVVLDDNHQYILHSNEQQLVSEHELQDNQTEFIIPDISGTHSFNQNQNISEVITSQHNVITQSMLGNSDIASTDELVMVLTDHDYGDGNNELINNDSSNIVVLYSHPVDGHENQFITSQGNLMVNSQTGLIEIRNGPTIATTTAEQLVVASAQQESHIESIEMIQKEIDSHVEIKPEYLQHTSQDSEHNESQLPEQYVHQQSNHQQIEFNTPDIVGGGSEESNRELNENYSQSEQEETTELVKERHETICESAQGNTDHTTTEAMETDENNQVYEQQQTHCVEESTDVEQGENTENTNPNEITNQDQEDFSFSEKVEETQQVVDPEENQGINKENNDNNDVNYNSDNLEQDASHDPENENFEQKETKSNNESESPVIQGKETNVENLTSEGIESKEYSQQNEISQEVLNDEESEENLQMDTSDELTANQESDNTRLGESADEVQINNNDNVQLSQTDENICEEEEEEEEENSLHRYEDNPNIDIHHIEDEDMNKIEGATQESTQESNSNFADDNSQTTHDEHSENSQSSQNSQSILSKSANQSTKISILDDWEDTDSQQSEHPELKSGNTVNKLMDDWADDEDIEDDSRKSV